MAGRGPWTDDDHGVHTASTGTPGDAPPGDTHPPPPLAPLVLLRDLAGRPRGTGFVADHLGTVVTCHEAVAGLPRLTLHDADGRVCAVTAEAVTPLPELNLALVRTEGLGTDPLPVTVREPVGTGTYVRLAAGCWREARVLGATGATYHPAGDRAHRLDGALELAIGTAGRDALRPGGGAGGGPVLDAGTGAVVAILGTALRSGDREAGFAVPLRPAAPGPLADLLARNAATVPAYGADLNLAGVLELTATSVASDGPPGAFSGHPGGPGGTPVATVERAATAREFAAFDIGPAAVLGLVGPPGSGRTTELAALAARRTRGPEPAPTLWLRGADLKADDDSLADAARRALTRAARIVAASRAGRPTAPAPDPASAGTDPADLGDIRPDRLARLAHAAGRPLLLLLDGPEEMPPVLAHRLADWTEGTAQWLRRTGARLMVACRAEYWERAGTRFPPGMLYDGTGPREETAGALPPCVPLGDLTPAEARAALARYGVPGTALTGPDARHPLTIRLLSEVRAALPDPPPAHPVDRAEVLSAHLDLMCLRIAVRLAAGNGLRGTAVRRLAAKVSGQVHEAARRSLGPGQGELDRANFEAVFPWGPAPARLGGGTGWASAVLTEGLLVPAGGGYRFAHEELADWIQGVHLDLDEALRALVHRRRTPGGAHPLPVPHHRIGPVVQALLLLGRQQGTSRLRDRLEELLRALDADRTSWWAARLLSETLLRVPDATPYTGILRLLADRIAEGGDQPDLGCAETDQPGRVGAEADQPGRVRAEAGQPSRVRAEAGQPGRVRAEPGRPCWGVTEGEQAARVVAGAEELRRGVAGSGRPARGVTEGEQAARGVAGDEEPRRGVAEGGQPDRGLTGAGQPCRCPAGARQPAQDPAGAGQPCRCPAGAGQPGHGVGGDGRARGWGEFGPGFWTRLALPPELCLDLLRRLVLADAAPERVGAPRYLDAVARLLADDSTAVQPCLTRWFDDERPLPATPHATVATAAQALLHTHRHRSPDDLTDLLVGCGHHRADELLAVLAEDEPSALCRAVDRWAHDERPARRVAALTYARHTAAHTVADADRGLLRHAALALLARPDDSPLHGGALALLVRDPETRDRHLPRALERFAAGDPELPPSTLLTALDTHPDPVLAAVRARLDSPGASGTLRALADATPPALAHRVAAVVREAVRRRPDTAGDVAAYVDHRLDQGPAARAVLLPLVTGLLVTEGPEQVRAALAGALLAPGTPASRPLRRELLEFLLLHEHAPAVLDAVLHAAPQRDGEELRALVHRTGLLLARTPDGATRFDRGLVELARHIPGFAARATGWFADAPGDWAVLVGPGARRTLEDLAGVRVPA
ncbi:trypsin-like peptidase domain-containing protein [Streptomyces sp. NPDC005811]|uniref:trypsin-like peptidase domain-containing protein n=1 Tax=Streptomyces sp. NPDC005811 TaxID=3154565 RepID=UPI0033C9055D